MALTEKNKKQIAAGLLITVLALVVYYQFFASGGASQATASRQITQSASPRSSPTRSGAGNPSLIGLVNTPIDKPLPLDQLDDRAVFAGGTGRNIFIYPPPTPIPTPKPPPPTPPPPPPPITITGLNPPGVIARMSDFKMTVIGVKIPSDAVVYIDSRSYPTAFTSETQVQVSVPAAAIRTAGNLRIEVKSQSDAQLYSNPLNLNVAEPPIPPFLYVALIINKNGVATAVLKSQVDGQLINVHQGEVIDKWRIIGINGENIEILDTSYNIPHTVAFTGEGS